MKLISRAEAVALNQKRYYSGKSCPHGHVAERLVSSYGCCACEIERSKRPGVRAYRDEYRRRPSSLKAQREYAQRPEVREKKLPHYRKWWIEHGNDPERQDARRVRQNLRAGHVPPPPKREWPPKPDLCECCEDKRKRLVMDHDHKTGALRGWVCDICNLLCDDPIRLQTRIDFLVRTNRDLGLDV